jgi:hypothetical protein
MILESDTSTSTIISTSTIENQSVTEENPVSNQIAFKENLIEPNIVFSSTTQIASTSSNSSKDLSFKPTVAKIKLNKVANNISIKTNVSSSTSNIDGTASVASAKISGGAVIINFFQKLWSNLSLLLKKI